MKILYILLPFAFEERFGEGCSLAVKSLICTAVGSTQKCHFLAGTVPFRLRAGVETLLKNSHPFPECRSLLSLVEIRDDLSSHIYISVIEQLLLASLSSKIISTGKIVGKKMHSFILLVRKSAPA